MESSALDLKKAKEIRQGDIIFYFGSPSRVEDVKPDIDGKVIITHIHPRKHTPVELTCGEEEKVVVIVTK